MNETKTVETHQSPTFTCRIHCALNGAKNQTATKALHSHITYKHCAPTHKAGTKCHYEWSKNTRQPPRPCILTCHVQTLCPNPQSWDKVSLRMEQKHQTPIKAQHSHVTYKHCAPTHKAGTKCHYEWNKNTRHPSRPSTHMSRTNTVPQPTKLGQSVITNGTKTPDTHQGPALTCHVQTLCPLPQSWDKVSLRMEQKHRTATKALHWHMPHVHTLRHQPRKLGQSFITFGTKTPDTHQGPALGCHVQTLCPSPQSWDKVSLLNGTKTPDTHQGAALIMSRTNTVPPPTKLGQSVITNGTKTSDSHQGPALARLIHTLRHLQESWDKVYTFAGTGLGMSGVTCPCGTQPSGAAISSKPWAYFHLPPCM